MLAWKRCGTGYIMEDSGMKIVVAKSVEGIKYGAWSLVIDGRHVCYTRTARIAKAKGEVKMQLHLNGRR